MTTHWLRKRAVDLAGRVPGVIVAAVLVEALARVIYPLLTGGAVSIVWVATDGVSALMQVPGFLLSHLGREYVDTVTMLQPYTWYGIDTASAVFVAVSHLLAAVVVARHRQRVSEGTERLADMLFLRLEDYDTEPYPGSWTPVDAFILCLVSAAICWVLAYYLGAGGVGGLVAVGVGWFIGEIMIVALWLRIPDVNAGRTESAAVTEGGEYDDS